MIYRSIFLLLALCLFLFPSCAAPLAPTLDLTPASQTLIVGQPLQVTVTRRFPGGQVEDVTARVAYTTSDRAIATVSERGVITAGSAPGAVIIKALDTASDATAVATFTVVGSRILSIDLSPSPAKVLRRGESQAYTATARFNNGSTQDVTAKVSWSSTNEAAALVGDTQFDKGVVRAVAPGDTTILATDGATLVQGRSVVFVPPDSLLLQALVVTPNPALASVGKTLQLRADGIYSDGSTADLTRGVTWSSSKVDVATVDGSGLMTGVILGDATISASAPPPYAAIKGSAAAKVVP